MKCHSAGCLGWPLTAAPYIFFSTLCIYYRNQITENNMLRHVILLILTTFNRTKTTLWFLAIAIMVNWYCIILAAFFLAGCRFACGIQVNALPCSWSWSTTVIESCSLSLTFLWYGKIQKDKANTRPQSSLDCPTALLQDTPKLAKWPWQGKHQLSIIDYQDFLHIHLKAPLSSLINIRQKVVRE